MVTIYALNILTRCKTTAATNGLVYGEVQSGKTTSMIVLAALAFDLGYKTVILLSGRINILRNQTQNRSQESMHIDEPANTTPATSRNNSPETNRKRKRSDDSSDESYDTESEDLIEDSPWDLLGEALIDTDAMERDDHMHWLTFNDKDLQNVVVGIDDLLQSTQLFAVLKKVPKSLECFTAFINGDFENSPWKKVRKVNPKFEKQQRTILKKLAELRSGPALIIDDECDDASVANTQRQHEGIPERMTAIRSSWPKEGTTSVCHYVGYTATPQANLMNHANDEFFPHFLWELSTQNKAYLGSQMYLNEELKNQIIKLIPYKDYPNLNTENMIMPMEEKRGLVGIQADFLQDLINAKSASPSMKQFLAYYVFTGAIRLQRNRPAIDIEAIVSELKGTDDPLSLIENDADDREALRSKIEEALYSNDTYGKLSTLDLRQLTHFLAYLDKRFSELFYKHYFNQRLVVAKIEELTVTRMVLYIVSEDGKFKTISSGPVNEDDHAVYILHYKNAFYRLNGPLETPSTKPMFHSAMVNASQSQWFIALMHSVVRTAWPIVEKDIKNQLSGKTEDYLTEIWNDLSPDNAVTEFTGEIRTVLKETQIKTAMCRGDPTTNMRTFDYSAKDTDQNAKSKPVPPFLIVVGGNMLSRGLTLEGLTVSWYTRASATKVADTTIQHQRWFGWRHGYMDLVRVFMQERQFEFFKEAVESEQKLRDVFRQMALNNWRPDRHSAALQEPINGRLTNKLRGNVEAIKMKRCLELKTPALEENASKNVLNATLRFWRDYSNSIQHHQAGDVVLHIPVDQVLQWLRSLDMLGMPHVSELLAQLNMYCSVCEEMDIEPKINVAIPNRKDVNHDDLNEYKDEDSQYIMQHRLGLHKRKRNPVIRTEFLRILGAKTQVSNREKHQFIDGVVNEMSPLPDWLVTKDTNADILMPDSRGSAAPLLLLVYFLYPRYRGRGKEHYPVDAPEAGKTPLVAIVGCFPDLKTRYVANRTVKESHYVYPVRRIDDEERPAKRARIEPESDDDLYIDSDEY